MSISKFRGILYTLAKFLGDIDAVRKGKIEQRVKRRILGKISSRILNKLGRK